MSAERLRRLVSGLFAGAVVLNVALLVLAGPPAPTVPWALAFASVLVAALAYAFVPLRLRR